jgi:putative hydrolase of HD superfamily
MEANDIVQLLLHGNQLKRTARTGWAQRGVAQGENVAAHSYGVAFTALVLARLIEAPSDLGKLLSLAILHDLPEGLTSDIPAPAWRYVQDNIKAQMEQAALQEIVGGTPHEGPFLALWQELANNESVEARLVHDADKIDLYLQALVYEEQTGNKHLADFWERDYHFHFAVAETVYQQLRKRRASIASG